MSEIIPIVWNGGHPLSVHLLLTTACNLSCPKCFYRRQVNASLSLSIIERLISEWAGKVQSLALGGGEPLLYPFLGQVVAMAKRERMYVAVTTNGTISPDRVQWFGVLPDRVHVSFDKLHGTDFGVAREGIDLWKRFGVQHVGVNHVVTDMPSLYQASELAKQIDGTITLLLEKPKPRASVTFVADAVFESLGEKVWLDPCLVKWLRENDVKRDGVPFHFINLECRQGYSSMSIDQDLTASLCSNSKDRVPCSNLKDTWGAVQKMVCPRMWR